MSRIVTFEDRGSFRKCVDESELDDKEQLICSSVNNGTAQFEVQLPKIQRHKLGYFSVLGLIKINVFT